MHSSFDQQSILAAKLPKITDEEGCKVFDSVMKQAIDLASAQTIYQEANKKRLGSTEDQHKAAYLYLALAFRLNETPEILGKSSPEKMFHFAAHAFRGIGQLNRSADAYWRAGVITKEKASPDEFGIRSLARAKSCFDEIGETDKSDEMHFLEWEARRLRSKRPSIFLFVWKLTSRYGTSVTAWLWSMLVFVSAFALAYEMLHCCKKLQETTQWTHLVTALYFTIVTTATVGYGEIVPCHWASQIVVALNILIAYVLLATGATILGRKVLGR